MMEQREGKKQKCGPYANRKKRLKIKRKGKNASEGKGGAFAGSKEKGGQKKRL